MGEEEKREPMVHELKIDPKYIGYVLSGAKPFEIRLNDREYAVGDLLHLTEYVDGSYGVDGGMFRVTYILDNPDYLVDGYVCLGIEPVDRMDTLRKYIIWKDVHNNG